MLRIVFALLTLIVPFGSLAGEVEQPPVGPRAIAVLLTTNPWLMVVGSDTPQFALYDDGQVIFVEQTSGSEQTHMAARLTPSELASVKQELLTFAVGSAPEKINLRPGWTDQPVSYFFLDVDGHKLATTVYGLGRSTNFDEAMPVARDGGDALPANIRALHQYLSAFHIETARKWIPEQLEVMIWDYSHAPDASVQWPAGWPGLNDPNTLKRGDAYSIFLPGTQEDALIAFLATQNEKGAIQLGGKKWSAAYRRVFPRWEGAFRGQ